jgi:hypothetical protein
MSVWDVYLYAAERIFIDAEIRRYLRRSSK